MIIFPFFFLFQKLKEKIMNEYAENKQDTNFLKAKEEFQYLHEKLAYIKKLVSDYDVEHPKTD